MKWNEADQEWREGGFLNYIEMQYNMPNITK